MYIVRGIIIIIIALIDLYESKEHCIDFAYLAAIAHLTSFNKPVTPREETLLQNFAKKLAVTTEEEFAMIQSNLQQ